MGFFLSLAVFLVILIVILNLKRLIVKFTTLRKWDEKANPHGELEQILPGIYRVQSTYHGKLWNMYVYPLMEGGLMIINPMVVRENVLNQILQLGEPKVLVGQVDSFCPIYTKDVYVWRQKFPGSIYICPKTAYNRLVRDIPLIAFHDLIIEVQIHNDDVEVTFPTLDRKELHILLLVKDKNANSDYPHHALIFGDMIEGPITPDGKMKEPLFSKLFSILSFNRSETADVLRRVSKKFTVVGLLPSHGLPLIDEKFAENHCKEVEKMTPSSVSSPYLPIDTEALQEEKKNCKAHVELVRLAGLYGPEKKPVKDKKND